MLAARVLAPAACLALPAAALAGDGRALRQELESVRPRIKAAQAGIAAAQDEIERMLAELRGYETIAAAARRALLETNREIAARQARLAQLNQELERRDDALREERRLLAEQVRAMHRAGGGDYLRLLLNQEDPAFVGRALAYHGYYNRARAARVDAVRGALSQLQALRDAAAEETAQLLARRAARERNLEELRGARRERQALLDRFRRLAADQGRQLQALRKTERELESLLEQLAHRAGDATKRRESPPFASLRGKLAWPVRGRITARYGDLERGGRLRSRGVTFAAAAGVAVRAVSAGRVIYADWFRNLGLLLILDHGGGFMSLYGHNEALLKKPGDWVERHAPVAKTGDTGGRSAPGLYFEIRQNGVPLDPAPWCAAR